MANPIQQLAAEDFEGHLIAELPDVPDISSADLKARFDSATVEVILPKLNETIEKANAVEQQAEGHGLMTPEDKAKLDRMLPPIYSEAVAVPTTAWVSDEEAPEDFAYRADVPAGEFTANTYPQVTFSAADVASGNFAPVCESASGIIKIWAREIPDETVTLVSIFGIEVIAQAEVGE